MTNRRIQNSNYQQQQQLNQIAHNLNQINSNLDYLNTRVIETEKKREAFETAVKQYAIVGILGLAATLLLYQNAGAIKPQLQSIGNLTMGDLQKVAGNGWKEMTLLFERSTQYLSSLLH
jgi:hypothetical protein